MSFTKLPQIPSSRRKFLREAGWTAAALALPLDPITSALTVDANPAASDQPSTTYYIDTAGSNQNSGTSPSQPWKDFAPVNSKKFGPGDFLLLKRGCVWQDELIINGSGAAGKFLQIAAYGSGARPRIQRNGAPQDRCVRLNNSSFLKLSNLEVSNGGAGIVLFYDHSYHNRSVYLDDIVAHDFMNIDDAAGGHRVSWSYGIGVTGREDTPNNQTTALSDLRITNTEVYNTGSGIALDWGNHFCVDGTLALSNKFTDVFMENLHLHDNTVPGISFVSLFLTSVSRCTIQNSVIDKGARHAGTGTSALQIMYSQDVTIKNVTISNTLLDPSPDNSAVDFECNNERVTLDGCTFTNNAGPAIEILATPNNANPFTRNFQIMNCTFVKNNWARKLGSSQISIANWQFGNTPTGSISGNKYNNAPNTTFFGGDGNTTEISLSNNQNIGTPEKAPQLLKEWKFDATGNSQGWTNGPGNGIRNLQVSGGALTGEFSGGDPNVVSPDRLGIAIGPHVFVRLIMENRSAGKIGQIYFTTDASPAFDEKKHRDFWLYAQGKSFQPHDVEMALVPGWVGTLRSLRVDPEQGVASGGFSIRLVQLLTH